MKQAKQSMDINIHTCVDQAGGNQFQMILIAATRAREIANSRLIAQRANPQLKYDTRVVTAALSEVEDGKIGREYLNKVRTAR